MEGELLAQESCQLLRNLSPHMQHGGLPIRRNETVEQAAARLTNLTTKQVREMLVWLEQAKLVRIDRDIAKPALVFTEYGFEFVDQQLSHTSVKLVPAFAPAQPEPQKQPEVEDRDQLLRQQAAVPVPPSPIPQPPVIEAIDTLEPAPSNFIPHELKSRRSVSRQTIKCLVFFRQLPNNTLRVNGRQSYVPLMTVLGGSHNYKVLFVKFKRMEELGLFKINKRDRTHTHSIQMLPLGLHLLSWWEEYGDYPPEAFTLRASDSVMEKQVAAVQEESSDSQIVEKEPEVASQHEEVSLLPATEPISAERTRLIEAIESEIQVFHARNSELMNQILSSKAELDDGVTRLKMLEDVLEVLKTT